MLATLNRSSLAYTLATKLDLQSLSCVPILSGLAECLAILFQGLCLFKRQCGVERIRVGDGTLATLLLLRM